MLWGWQKKKKKKPPLALLRHPLFFTKETCLESCMFSGACGCKCSPRAVMNTIWKSYNNVSHKLLDSGLLRRADILACCIRVSANWCDYNQEEEGEILRFDLDLCFSFTALLCSHTLAGSPHLSSVSLSLFILALKILGMSSLCFSGCLLTTQMCRVVS